MKSTVQVLKACLCGPADVAKEINIAREVVTEWNLQHSDGLNCYVKHQHWMTDATPDVSDRSQAIINRQMIDDADIVVAIFWSRFGTPTGQAQSGTEEEIRRGVAQGKKVMVYFSDLEPLPPTSDARQLAQLSAFRQFLQSQGLCWSFSSRQQFRQLFQRHLAKTIHELLPAQTGSAMATTHQSIIGDNNIQAAGPVNIYNTPPRTKTVVARREGSVNRSQEKQIHKWIEALAEGTVGKARTEAYAEWWSRFKNRFGITKYEDLRSDEITAAKAWYTQQRGIQTRGLKTKAPDDWRASRIRAIKAFMSRNGYTNDIFYPLAAERLRMKRPITSLKALTKRDLDRVYNLVMRDPDFENKT